MNIIDIFRSLRAGQELSNAETWKRRQVAVNALVVLITVAITFAKSYGYDLPISEEQIGDLAGGVYGLVSMFNAWATLSTTSRIGLPARDRNDVPGVADGVRDGSSEVGSRDWVHELDDRDSFPVPDMRDRG